MTDWLIYIVFSLVVSLVIFSCSKEKIRVSLVKCFMVLTRETSCNKIVNNLEQKMYVPSEVRMCLGVSYVQSVGTSLSAIKPGRFLTGRYHLTKLFNAVYHTK